MPRLKQDKYFVLQSLIMGGVVGSGKTREELAKYMDLSTHTLQKRLDDPSQLTLKNISDLCWILGIPIDAMRNAIPR